VIHIPDQQLDRRLSDIGELLSEADLETNNNRGEPLSTGSATTSQPVHIDCGLQG